MKRGWRTTLSALTLAAVAGSAFGLVTGMLDATVSPKPDPERSPLSQLLGVRDCVTEDQTGDICVWDAQHRGDGTGQSFLVVGTFTFKVGTNEDGTIWIDDNHDGEPGYPDN